ncbi:hypothetical protein OG429_01985 [Streptomyces sp. NBC_00190]|uniref:hypothetical protein n=1 Tax=unclassified Streptomyces TaxID=2593676 RepID=UPI002E29DFC7|nr:hypothetical protein [Streptomyces sp. NBC_00190]WSZ38199.1 hypothetical protein OG239_04980 [Streptomyces sp. NBC_00868]
MPGASLRAPSGSPPVHGLFRTSEYPKLPILETLATTTGEGSFWHLADHGINGAYCLDSVWHHGWETIAALIATTQATSR